MRRLPAGGQAGGTPGVARRETRVGGATVPGSPRVNAAKGNRARHAPRLFPERGGEGPARRRFRSPGRKAGVHKRRPVFPFVSGRA